MDLSVDISVEWMSSKLALCADSYWLVNLYFLQWFRRWDSSSCWLHVEQIVLNDPLKFLPHSSMPYLAVRMVLVSWRVHNNNSGLGLRVYSSLDISGKMWAVLALMVFLPSTIL